VTAFYVDSSALVKRYAPETGSTWVTSLGDPVAGHSILIGEITVVEVAAALAAKARIAGGLTTAQRDAALGAFLNDCDDGYLLIGLDRATLDLAVDLTQRHVLRAYDAVQLATSLLSNSDLVARALPPLTFVSSDQDLLKAARAEGLLVDDPILHS